LTGTAHHERRRLDHEVPAVQTMKRSMMTLLDRSILGLFVFVVVLLLGLQLMRQG